MNEIKKSLLKEYSKNVELMFAAAKALDYQTSPIKVSGLTDLDELGFVVNHNNKTCYISGRSFFPTVLKWQHDLMSNKMLTSSFLKQIKYNQVPTLFLHPELHIKDSQIKDFISESPLPLIMKATHGYDGSQVYLIKTKKDALIHAKSKLLLGDTVLIQPYVDKVEYRIFMTGGKVAFVHRKRFPKIIGDGVSTIETLLEKATYVHQDITNIELKKHGYIRSSILKEGEIIRTHFTKKTDPAFYINKDIPLPIKKWSEELSQRMSVGTMGIDVFIDGDFNDPKKFTVIELNSNPGLRYISKYFDDKITPITVAMNILREYFE